MKKREIDDMIYHHKIKSIDDMSSYEDEDISIQRYKLGIKKDINLSDFDEENDYADNVSYDIDYLDYPEDDLRGYYSSNDFFYDEDEYDEEEYDEDEYDDRDIFFEDDSKLKFEEQINEFIQYNKHSDMFEKIIGNNYSLICDKGNCLIKFIGQEDSKTVFINNNIKCIKENVFENCKMIENIIISNSLKEIKENAFIGCDNLKNIYYNGTFDEWRKLNEWSKRKKDFNLLNYSENLYIYDENGNVSFEGKKYTIFDHVLVTERGNYTFDNTIKILEINCEKINFGAFRGCNSVNTLIIDINKFGLKGYIGYIWGANYMKQSLYVPSSLENIILINCDYILYGCFYNCENIKRLVLPKTIKNIYKSAFFGCSGLTCIYFGGSHDEWENIKIEQDNESIKKATIYYYSESKPIDKGNYWHYINGDPVEW